MNDDHRREERRQVRFDTGLCLAIVAVLYAYVLFFAFVFTDAPRLPRPASRPLIHHSNLTPYGD